MREKSEHWRQDTPRDQMVVLTQAIAGYANWFAEDLCDLRNMTPEQVQGVFRNIKERCDDLFELSKWMDSTWS